MTGITHQEYLDAIAFLNQWFAADPERTIDDIQSYTPAGDALYRIQEYERVHEIEQPPVAFRIDTAERLAWYTGKLVEAEAKKKRIQAQADAMIADVDRDVRGLQWRYGEQAESMLRELLTQGRKGAKSVKFLTGTITLKKTPGRVKFDGDLTNIPFELYEHVVSKKVDATALNKLIKVVGNTAYDTSTGQELSFEGLSVTPEGEKIAVKAEEL